ncbi:MAG TPA: 2,3-diaminopropionate biosynthesis protein SbnA [Longimicrobiaceae bacterium]|nr:2,3-diaminopropionate biosynthesis protein SbnA [Longimicrobiaceae bacterium]
MEKSSVAGYAPATAAAVLPRPVRGRGESGILSAIGNTPLVRLRRLWPGAGLRVYAKLESVNPGGSMKDRPAAAILEGGIASGAIRHDTVIIEQSSGNMGIGLAQACGYHGLRFICVVDPKTTVQNVRILRSYGAELDYVTEPDPATGEFLPAKLARIQALLREFPNSFWPNQYENQDNPASHYTTMHEVATAMDGDVDYLFVGTSTCGTIRGCAEYVRDHGMKTRIVAVDSVGSLIFTDRTAKRLIPGLGAAVKPPFFDSCRMGEYVHVNDLDCVVGCRRLVRAEAILAGGSAGGIVSAFDNVVTRIPSGSTCVMVLPDRGERYLDTIYSDEWVREHFGEVSHLWETKEADVA